MGQNGPKFEHFCDFLADPDSRSFSRFGAMIMQVAVRCLSACACASCVMVTVCVCVYARESFGRTYISVEEDVVNADNAKHVEHQEYCPREAVQLQDHEDKRQAGRVVVSVAVVISMQANTSYSMINRQHDAENSPTIRTIAGQDTLYMTS